MSKLEIITRLLINLIINVLIFSKIKIFFYRLLFGYDIAWNVKLGFCSLFICKKLRIDKNVKIGMFVLFYDCVYVIIKKTVKIYRFVSIRGANILLINEQSLIGTNSQITSREKDRISNGVLNGGRFYLGRNSVITSSHYFDLTGSIYIGNQVVVGGRGSMFYTHGFDCYGNFSYGNIIIENQVYIGASSLLLQGISVGNEIVIGAGSTVAKSLDGPGAYVGASLRKLSDTPKSKHIFYSR